MPVAVTPSTNRWLSPSAAAAPALISPAFVHLAKPVSILMVSTILSNPVPVVD
ncbi:hypothetical protein [Microcystis aeruginosa]|uniref:hypothetical protein n=1 Tax=Microcystis aeruginosa TaxID=1126 RepID=UPI001C12A4DB|nr:hypothetical protein [Microcystis aeruginosa]